jgi:polyferredoxin
MLKLLKKLESEIFAIKERNSRVERDKAWEMSRTRRAIIFLSTYIVVASVLLVSGIPDPFINALIPSIAFILSTATLGFAKGWWLQKYKD